MITTHDTTVDIKKLRTFKRHPVDKSYLLLRKRTKCITLNFLYDLVNGNDTTND